MNKSNISVVIPYYNDSLNFERTLQSVCNQTLQPLEVIIIDDACVRARDYTHGVSMTITDYTAMCIFVEFSSYFLFLPTLLSYERKEIYYNFYFLFSF